MTKVTYGFQGNINYTTNITCQIVSLTLQTGADYTTKQTFPTTTFQSKLPVNAFSLDIAQISRTKGGTGFDSPTIPIWTQNGSTVTISYIGGLQDSSNYSLTLFLK